MQKATVNISQIRTQLRRAASPAKAQILSRFFKTGPGEYGAGDKFLGIVVPDQRRVARQFFRDIDIRDAESLLHSPYHEERLTALLILVAKFERADDMERERIYKLYLRNTKFINNWDLVDLSAPNIVGRWLLPPNYHAERRAPKGPARGKISRSILYKLVKSILLWDRRIAVLATFTFIRAGQYDDTLALAKMLLTDTHDLIHKAVGWMLRELGKRDEKKLIDFLDQYSPRMPRTMLRYAIEKLSERKRKYYLSK